MTETASTSDAPTTASTPQSAPITTTGPSYRGDNTTMPSFAGWAWGVPPADAAAKAGFDWFETGYPDPSMVAVNATLLAANVRPFAYINLSEVDPPIASIINYTGPILRTNSEFGTLLVDVTDPSWQAWILRRADEAYAQGSRGVKWDVATPDVPPGKTRQDVNDAIASMMKQIRAKHPDMKFLFNQGTDFILAYPDLADAAEDEGLMSASSSAAAWCAPWLDPYYWGPKYQGVEAVHALGKPVIIAEYYDPASTQGQQLYDCTVAQGFVPYIQNSNWQGRGRGYNVNAGW